MDWLVSRFDDNLLAYAEAYRANFGADYFGFWYCGLRCLIINSPLMVDPKVFCSSANTFLQLMLNMKT
jgi:hypothetical protein